MGKNKIRLVLLGLVITLGLFLLVSTWINRPKTVLETSFTPVYQLMGKPVYALNRSITRVMTIRDEDEGSYGDRVAQRFSTNNDAHYRDQAYVKGVLSSLKVFARKKFEYRVFLSPGDYPNAFAIAGGVIVVTEGLLRTLRSESELAAVLAHEMGHIELSHCLDLVRTQLLMRKSGIDDAGSFADWLVYIFLNHTFSKTDEDAADEYAFRLLLETDYDPRGVSEAFASMERASHYREKRRADILRDYFTSHPPLSLRTHKFRAKAHEFWANYTGERYVGTRNLENRQALFYDYKFPGEWVTAAGISGKTGENAAPAEEQKTADDNEPVSAREEIEVTPPKEQQP